ncbi:hypothetical protein VTK56DRAFT_1661 [Thermocarpiscus australiensis]
MDGTRSQSQGAAAWGNTDAAFKKFDSYPWVHDRSFLQGLMATLGPSFNKNTDGFMRQRALSATLQARIWWYKSRFNIDIDRTSYETWSVSNPSSCPDAAIIAKLQDIQQRMGIAPASSSTDQGPTSDTSAIPAWQLNAPKVDLSKKADDGADRVLNGDGPPYPADFEALIAAVKTGKPIPGIKEIPNIVVRPPGVTPFGKMKAPPKPWEKHRPPDSLDQPSIFGNVVDPKFPPLPEENGGGDNSAAEEPEKSSP